MRAAIRAIARDVHRVRVFISLARITHNRVAISVLTTKRKVVSAQRALVPDCKATPLSVVAIVPVTIIIVRRVAISPVLVSSMVSRVATSPVSSMVSRVAIVLTTTSSRMVRAAISPVPVSSMVSKVVISPVRAVMVSSIKAAMASSVAATASSVRVVIVSVVAMVHSVRAVSVPVRVVMTPMPSIR